MEDFICFEMAKKLKEKGFNEGSYKYYDDKELKWSNSPWLETQYNDFLPHTTAAPTISQVLKWLRDKFSLHISQKPYPCEDGLMWMYEIRKFNKYIVFVIANKTGFVEEEEASLAGIEYAIDNLI